MTINVDTVLFIVAAVCFVLAGLSIPKANWLAWGLLAWVLTNLL